MDSGRDGRRWHGDVALHVDEVPLDWKPRRRSQNSIASSNSSGSIASERSLKPQKTQSNSILPTLIGHGYSFGSMATQDKNNEDEPRPSWSSTVQSCSSSNSLASLLAQNSQQVFGIGRLSIAQLARSVVQSKTFSLIMFMLSVFVLFGDDIRLAFYEKDADVAFNVFTLVAIGLFTLELVLTSAVVDDYFLSFFFYLDVISTASLVLDLKWVQDILMGNENDGPDTQKSGSEYARAGRTSRVGTRVARILRVVRLIRMIRIWKLWAHHGGGAQRSIQRAHPGEGFRVDTDVARASGRSRASVNDGMDMAENESRVGKKLSGRTTISVIILVLAMLVVTPLLETGEESTMMTESPQYGADLLHEAWYDIRVEEHRAVSTTRTQSTIDVQKSESAWESAQKGGLEELWKEWEEQLILFVYYHNFQATRPVGMKHAQDDFLYKLSFLGYITSSNDPSRDAEPLAERRNGSVGDANAFGHDTLEEFPMGGWLPLRLQEQILERPLTLQSASPWTGTCQGYSGSTIQGISLMSEPCPWKHVRPQESMWYISSGEAQTDISKGQIVLFFDLRDRVRLDAIMSILRTVFIIIVLTTASVLFSRDTDKLVLHPIERMIAKIDAIRRDPLYAIKLCEQQEQIHKQEAQKAAVNLETKILENMIIKLGSLLAIGFGEAGSEVIGRNLDGDTVAVDPMIPGRTVEAIYGVCKIRDFVDLTEVLQERTMVFVNRVAEILHRNVNQHNGAANTNLGAAFLLVWRVRDPRDRVSIANLSVMAFIRAMIEVTGDGQLASYLEHPALVARLGKKPVRLGCGLHLGWSIEGAIGSEYKIDASYLSPHVTMATSLEAATSEYRVTILMSEALVRSCDFALALNFRVIDHIRMQGMKESTRLFTVDLDLDRLRAVTLAKTKVEKGTARLRLRRDALGSLGITFLRTGSDLTIADRFAYDPSIRRVRASYPIEFFQAFEKGFLNYEAGEWDVAVTVFEETRSMLGSIIDGPSDALLNFMRGYGCSAPNGWAGFRDLGVLDAKFAAGGKEDDNYPVAADEHRTVIDHVTVEGLSAHRNYLTGSQ